MVLREGDSGPAVRVLQEALNRTGLRGVRDIAVDGIFGPQTNTAVRNFQAHDHITVDGIAGPQTRAALGVR
jgi:peptidoglycan hydrolase-like protein with peptidoglycan-binding domain